MGLPSNKTESLRFLKRTVIRGFALIPLTILLGNVYRVRAQYVPNVVQLDPEDGKDVMGVSYLRMLKRVNRLEGWKGLLRGIVPLSIVAAAATLWYTLSSEDTVLPFHPIVNAIVRFSLVVLFDVPFTIIFVRCIITPETLPFLGLTRALRTLLSPTERQRPWLLYTTPGLLHTFALQRAWEILLLPVLVKLVTRHVARFYVGYGMSVQTLVQLSLVFVHTAIVTPLEVVSVRLAIQHSEKKPVMFHEDDGNEPDTVDPTDRVDFAETTATGVVRLRSGTELPAYTSLLNCVRSIKAEEGLETFYRAWWFTLLMAVLQVGIVFQW